MPDDPVRRRALVRPPVVLVDLAIPVLVHVDVLRVNGAVAVGVLPQRRVAIHLVLVDVERVDRAAGLEHLDEVTDAARDAAREDHLAAAGAYGVDLDDLVRVLRRVEARGPREIAVLPAEEHGVESELHALVLQAADVRGDEVGREGPGRHRHSEQQVVGVLVVVLDGTGEPVVHQAEVDADVVGGGLLPLDAPIGGARPDRGHELVAELVLGLRSADVVRRVLLVEIERLVPVHAVRDAELQIRDHVEVLHELLVGQAPSERRRGEQAPLLVRPEL